MITQVQIPAGFAVVAIQSDWTGHLKESDFELAEAFLAEHGVDATEFDRAIGGGLYAIYKRPFAETLVGGCKFVKVFLD